MSFIVERKSISIFYNFSKSGAKLKIYFSTLKKVEQKVKTRKKGFALLFLKVEKD